MPRPRDPGREPAGKDADLLVVGRRAELACTRPRGQPRPGGSHPWLPELHGEIARFRGRAIASATAGPSHNPGGSSSPGSSAPEAAATIAHVGRRGEPHLGGAGASSQGGGRRRPGKRQQQEPAEAPVLLLLTQQGANGLNLTVRALSRPPISSSCAFVCLFCRDDPCLPPSAVLFLQEAQHVLMVEPLLDPAVEAQASDESTALGRSTRHGCTTS